jgi:uncharacterized protein (DUF697 family)
MDLPLRMKTAIGWSAGLAGAVGVPGAFAAHGDVPILIGIWTTLLVRLAFLAGKDLDKGKAAKIVAGVLLAIGGFAGGVKLMTTAIAYTGIGTIPAMVANAGANATLTYFFGRSTAKVFLSNDHLDSASAIIAAIVAIMTGGHSPDSPSA